MIKPTIGRQVWYWPTDYDRAGETGMQYRAPMAHGDKSQACAATIVYVHGDRMVNLSVTDHNGIQHARCSVPLLQDGDLLPVDGCMHAQWMPYQAAKAKDEGCSPAGATSGEVAGRGAAVTDDAIEQEILAKTLTLCRVRSKKSRFSHFAASRAQRGDTHGGNALRS